MNERAEALRRRIATYRRWLAEGVPTEFARDYLNKIASAESELTEIEKNNDKRE
jgi:hypothetical protein